MIRSSAWDQSVPDHWYWPAKLMPFAHRTAGHLNYHLCRSREIHLHRSCRPGQRSFVIGFSAATAYRYVTMTNARWRVCLYTCHDCCAADELETNCLNGGGGHAGHTCTNLSSTHTSLQPMCALPLDHSFCIQSSERCEKSWNFGTWKQILSQIHLHNPN